MTGDYTDINPSARTAAAEKGAADARSIADLHLVDPGGLLPIGALSVLKVEAQRALSLINHPGGGEIRVRLIADAEMAAAHLKFSNIPGTTDVLTFDLSEGASAQGEPLDLDILICVDEARRQATSRSHTTERELLLYILHGTLHGLGFNDHDEAEYERMHAEEDRILTAIGIGAVFSAPFSPPTPRPTPEHT